MKTKQMSYQEFIQQIKVKGNLYMPMLDGKNERYPLLVTERNGEKIHTSDGLIHIMKMPEMDMQEVYERCGRFFDEVILKKMLAEYTEEYKKHAELDKKEQERLICVMSKVPEEQIYCVLIPGKMGIEILETYAGRKMESVYLIYVVILEEKPELIRVSAVTNEMLEYWNIKEEALYRMSLLNMPRHLFYKISELYLQMGEDIYLVKSEKNYFGLATLLYEEGPLKDLGNQLNQDLYILPLSVHEAVVFPYKKWQEKEIQDISEQMPVFSGTIWRYSLKLNKIAFSKKTWEKYMAALKYGFMDAADRR
ncbi:hypothetical protein DXA60_01175 [Roseburia sp. OF03-24]|uniref:DUF5688 family protein n=1 Tax=Roseburia sp. OF03-24 TaxID=2292367 RepID=UPI000E4C5EFC|nr:DUF5688 family protein [Roseburia sp. OF03-24]RGX94930.1 hypothetical protein DXA60_01175 [Roseburia sp. OF03-24]